MILDLPPEEFDSLRAVVRLLSVWCHGTTLFPYGKPCFILTVIKVRTANLLLVALLVQWRPEGEMGRGKTGSDNVAQLGTRYLPA